MLSLPLAAIALAVFLLSGGIGSTQQAHAVTGPDMSLSTGSCTSVSGNSPAKTKCSVTAGASFTVSFNVVKALAGGYAGYDMAVSYAGNVNYKAGSLVQPSAVGVGCAPGGVPNQNTACFYNDFPVGDAQNTGVAKPLAPSELGNGTMNSASGQGPTHPNPSTYSGSVATMDFVCKADGQGTITLVHGDGNTDLADPGLAPHSEAADESLTINCVPATFTPTATATSTPPPIPRVFKSPALQNVFLTRQGNKIPPSRCEDGTNVALLNEQINQAPVTINPKGDGQTVAAFEFEVRFDPTKVCVNLAPAASWTANPAVICTVQDKDSSTLEGIARIGCVTIGKAPKAVGLDLATIEVRPQPELYSQIRPNQDNGNVVQILNQGCELADEQGHAIAIFSCEDADITFRYLEGDVDGPDCDVDIFDTQSVAFRWGVQKGSLLYTSFLDLEPSGQVKGDGDIDIKDIQFVFGRFGSTCALPHPPQPPVNSKA
jgi:hypothetical protein